MRKCYFSPIYPTKLPTHIVNALKRIADYCEQNSTIGFTTEELDIKTHQYCADKSVVYTFIKLCGLRMRKGAMMPFSYALYEETMRLADCFNYGYSVEELEALLRRDRATIEAERKERNSKRNTIGNLCPELKTLL